MEEIYTAGSSGLTYTHGDYINIVHMYTSGMSLEHIYCIYAKQHKGLSLRSARTIVLDALMRYVSLLRYWKKERQE